MNIWVASTSGLFWIMPPSWIFMYRSWHEDGFSILLGVYLEGKMLGHMRCLTFWGTVKLFVAAPLYKPTSSVWSFQFCHNLTNTVVSGFPLRGYYSFLRETNRNLVVHAFNRVASTHPNMRTRARTHTHVCTQCQAPFCLTLGILFTSITLGKMEIIIALSF